MDGFSVREQKPDGLDGAVLGPKSFVLRYFSEGSADDRLLVVNLGERQLLAPIAEPLQAPPLGSKWETLWSSESTRYGGSGVTTVATRDSWILPPEAAVALRPVPEKAPLEGPPTIPKIGDWLRVWLEKLKRPESRLFVLML